MRQFLVAAGMFAAMSVAGAEPSDTTAGTLTELAMARPVTVQLPPSRPEAIELRRESTPALASGGTVVRQSGVTRSMWITLGNGF